MYVGQLIGLVAAFMVAMASSTYAQGVYIEGDEYGYGQPKKEAVMPLRSFERFPFDPYTATGFWGEAGALYSEFDLDPGEVDTTTVFGRLAYGAEKWEAGLQLPYYFADLDLDMPNGHSDSDEDGVGDLSLYGKFVPLQKGMIKLGLGGQVSVPTGDEDKFGTGEVGLLPFITGGIDLEVVEGIAHVGWNFLTGHDSSPDSLVYGFGLLAPVPMIGDYVALRNEFVGEQFDTHGKPKTVSYLPGLDIRIPAGPLNILLRPTGQVGITEESPDWGVGGSIALAQAPPTEAPPPPPTPVAVAPPPPPPPPPPAPKKKIVLRGVNFDFDKSDIRPDAQPVLDAAAETLSENPDVRVVAEGYTDDIGTEAYNQALSERRARAVMNYLVNLGIPAARITAVGFGESNPVASNATADGRAQNRRVELKVEE